MSALTREDITKHGLPEYVADLMLRQIQKVEDIGKPEWRDRAQGLRGVQEALEAALHKLTPIPPVGSRWVVRICTQWSALPFKFRTFSVSSTKEDADFLRWFCGSYVHTEVHVVEIKKGIDAFADYLGEYEHRHSRGAPLHYGIDRSQPPRRDLPSYARERLNLRWPG